MITGDTIAAIATAPGRGGVAVIRVSGPDALSIAGQLTRRSKELRVKREELNGKPLILHSSFFTPNAVIDEGLLLVFKAPHSYTGEDVVEFQCHGGTVTPRRILEASLAAGARLARRGEFTERALLNGKLDYDQAESVLDLIEAKTNRAADAALEGLAGRKRRELQGLYEVALDLSTRLEHALDIDEGELPVGFADELRVKSEELRAKIGDALRRAHEGRILRDGALVVLAGPPNAGKSSLLNALLEENRAIVSDTPGTTRDAIEEWMDLDGWPVRLVDTAGLRETKDEVEGEGVRRAEELLSRADVVLWLGSSTVRPPTSDLQPLILHPKCDLGRGEGLTVSSKTGEGLSELKAAIVAKLSARAAQIGEEASGDGQLAVLQEVWTRLVPSEDLVLLANAVRTAAERLGEAIGATYSHDLLDNLFSRFCVGK